MISAGLLQLIGWAICTTAACIFALAAAACAWMLFNARERD